MDQDYDGQKIKRDGADALIKASTLRVADTESWYKAREVRRMAKLLDREAERHYKEIKAPINKMRIDILELEDLDRKPMIDAMEMLDPQILSYEEKENLVRQKLQTKLEQDARREAEAAREQEVSLLIKAGDYERAEELKRQPLHIPPVVVPPGNELLEGEGRMETWEAEVFDLVVLCQAVLNGRVPLNAIQANQSALNGMARALKDSFEIPGCRVRKKRSIIQR